MAGIVVRKRKIQPILVVISLAVGLVVATVIYFIYRSLVEQLKYYAGDLPSYITKNLPVESWWIIPLSVAVTCFLIVSVVAYWVIILLKYLRHKHNGSPSLN